jgi:hypothetical protein
MVRIGWALPLAAALTLSACGGGDLGVMTGRQALQGRDIGDLYFWKARTLTFTRNTADPSQPEPQDFLVLPLDDPAPQVALTGIDWIYPSQWPIWFSSDLLLTGSQFQRVYDIGLGASADLSVEFPSPPVTDPLRKVYAATAMRSDGRTLAQVQMGGTDTIIVGRPSEFQAFKIPDGGSIGGLTFLGSDLALLIKEPAAGGDVVGIKRLNTSTGGLTTLVAPSPAAEWVGVTGFCDGVDPRQRCGVFGNFGCAVNEPACASGSPPPCQILFAKADPADATKTVTYAYDVGTATSTPLPGADLDHLFGADSIHTLVWGSTDATSYWNVCTDARGQCPFATGTVINWRPDGGAFVMFGPQELLRVVDIAGAACVAPDAEKSFAVNWAQFSSTNDRLWWVAAGDTTLTTQTLWLADAVGGSPSAVVSGSSIGATFSRDGQSLYVAHGGESSTALGWFDLTASPLAEKILSTNRGPAGLLGNRRALFVDHFNSQDDNGELVLVDLMTDARQSLAHAVTDVSVAGGSEAEGTDVAYTVRGRAASSSDGLWLTTLPP